MKHCKYPNCLEAGSIGSASISFSYLYHLHLLVARHLRQCLQIHLPVSRDHAHNMPCPVTVQHQCLEYACDILSQTVRNVLRRQIVLIEFVRNQTVSYAGLVQEACGICLFYLFAIMTAKIE